MKKRKGLLIIIAGPSGVGKGTIRKLVMEEEKLNLVFSISYTTRKPRKGEKDGVDYFFITKSKFEKLIKENDFLEYAQFVDNYYGTSKTYVNKLLKKGKNVILEIEVNGSKQIIDQYDKNDILTFFIVPPNLKELKKRLMGRNTESIDVINNRLKKAKEELKYKKIFNHIVINDIPQRAANEIKDIILNRIKN